MTCGLGAGRGVPTTQCWETAIRDALPIIHEGVQVQTKLVLLAMAPGDSQQELGAMFKHHKSDPTGLFPKMQNRKLLDQWQVIPTKTFE